MPNVSHEEDLPFGNYADEVKGPDEKVWGADSKRPAADPTSVDIEPVDDKGKPMEVKGPDPKVWGKQDKSD